MSGNRHSLIASTHFRSKFNSELPLYSLVPPRVFDVRVIHPESVQLTMLAAPESLLDNLLTGQIVWQEFADQYTAHLSKSPIQCQLLRKAAFHGGLRLICRLESTTKNEAVVIEQHLLQLECVARWGAGLMIGGYTFPIRKELSDLGGLWYSRHKAWVMPDKATWHEARRLFPVDF